MPCCGYGKGQAQCCITCDDEGQLFGAVVCGRQCGLCPCMCCKKGKVQNLCVFCSLTKKSNKNPWLALDDDNHHCAIIFSCCQCDLLWPCALLYRCATCKICTGEAKLLQGTGGPSTIVDDSDTPEKTAPSVVGMDRC